MTGQAGGKPRHFLDLADFSTAEIEALLASAKALKARHPEAGVRLRGDSKAAAIPCGAHQFWQQRLKNSLQRLNVHLDATCVRDVVQPPQPHKRAIAVQVHDVIGLHPAAFCHWPLNGERTARIQAQCHAWQRDEGVAAGGAAQPAQRHVRCRLRHAVGVVYGRVKRCNGVCQRTIDGTATDQDGVNSVHTRTLAPGEQGLQLQRHKGCKVNGLFFRRPAMACTGRQMRLYIPARRSSAVAVARTLAHICARLSAMDLGAPVDPDVATMNDCAGESHARQKSSAACSFAEALGRAALVASASVLKW